MHQLKELFLLDPQVIYLNHGSFGACPRVVFEAYQSWQRELERQPVEFLGRRFSASLDQARVRLADFLGAAASQVVLFPNPTTALNMVARNLDRLVAGTSGGPLLPGDQVLSTDHEYGALDRTWNYYCDRYQLAYVKRALPLPLAEPQQLAEHFWSGVNERTRLVFLSHITSPTAMELPVQEITRRARHAGIVTVIDGAHAPGQVGLDLETMGADIYAGACHKWLMAPKGSGFLYGRAGLEEFLDPLVISWGYRPEPGYGSGNAFADRHEWQGTRDIAAYLSIPAAIDFQRENNWESVRQASHLLALEARRKINQLTGEAPLCSEQSFHQMFAARLPGSVEPEPLMKRLYARHRIEVPVFRWNEQTILRVSIQGYNSREDIESLLEALSDEYAS